MYIQKQEKEKDNLIHNQASLRIHQNHMDSENPAFIIKKTQKSSKHAKLILPHLDSNTWFVTSPVMIHNSCEEVKGGGIGGFQLP